MSTENKPSDNIYYEERRDQIVSAFSGELQKAGFSVPDENIAKILDTRRHKLTRKIKSHRQEVLSKEDSELLEQHRSLKKRLHSVCDEVVAKRSCSAAKIQETAKSCNQTTQETLSQRLQVLEKEVTTHKSSVDEGPSLKSQVKDNSEEAFVTISKNWEKIKKLSKVIGDLDSMNLPIIEDLCDVQHLGRETMVLDEDGIEKNGVILDDHVPLVIDYDHDIIPNNAKVVNS